ncbi:MAG: amidohydrolase [Clostridium sp.]|uniref:M20 metallopeptidase family protein n=1 Tax=Clostridium sp. TaxID=1506 RepID=UPI002FCB76D5
MIDFREEANKIKKDLIDIRRDIHMHPEVGFEEVRTSNLIKNFLEVQGIDYKSVAGTGICGIIKGTKEGKGKTIAIRADMDALPIQDNKVCEYKSTVKGKMHACGHDGHTTILLGVSKILNENKHLFSGNVKLLFEPAEETTGGASVMISEGVLENPSVDKVIGLHVSEDVECGKIKIKNGVVNAASNPYKINIKGSGGHGAAPSATVDPIVIGANVVSTLQTIVSREISAVNPAVVTVGTFHGGTAQNIIPEEVEISGIIRTMTVEDREFACRRVTEIAEGIATVGRGSAKVLIEESYPCLTNNDDCVSLIRNAANKILGEENVLEQKAPSMGVESFAYFAMERPAAFYFLGTSNKDKGTNKSAHSSLFDIDEDALPLGVAIQCQAAFDYLTME